MSLRNIELSGQLMRGVFGALLFAIALGLAYSMRGFLNVSVIGTLFVLYWMGALGIVQASRKTCVHLASRGEQETATGVCPIQSEVDREQLKRQGNRVHVEALMVAVVATLATGFLAHHLP